MFQVPWLSLGHRGSKTRSVFYVLTSLVHGTYFLIFLWVSPLSRPAGPHSYFLMATTPSLLFSYLTSLLLSSHAPCYISHLEALHPQTSTVLSSLSFYTEKFSLHFLHAAVPICLNISWPLNESQHSQHGNRPFFF